MARRHLALWMLLLLLFTSHRANQQGLDNNEGVPADFRYLDEAEHYISQAEWRAEDLRSGEEQLRQWGEADQSLHVTARLEEAKRLLDGHATATDRSLPQLEGVDHEVILMIGSDETVESSGDSLFQKKGGMARQRSLMQWNENTQHFSLLSTRGANNVEVTPHTKLIFVGHGGFRDGHITLGGKTSRQLAEAVLSLSKEGSQLHWSSNMKTLHKVSLVSCDVGAGPGGKKFVEELLVNLREGGLEVGSVSARTVTTYVLPDGTKRTSESDNSELWSKHNPMHKNKFYLGDNNKLLEITDSSGKTHQWLEHQKDLLELHPLVRPRNFPLYLKEVQNYYTIDDDIVNDIIEIKVRELFPPGGRNVQNLVDTEVKMLNLYTTKNHMQWTPDVRTVLSMNGLLDNIKEITQSANQIRREMLEKKLDLLLRESIIDNNNFNLKTTWEKLRQRANENEELKTLELAINKKLSSTFRYYRFKDFVYRINLKTFYAYLYGSTTGPVEIDATTLSQVDYNSIGNMHEANTFVEMANNWVQGNHDAISNNINVYNGLAVIATHISEAVRNPRVFLTNRLMWDTTSTWSDFRDNNPMARGRTWPDNHAAIGLDYVPTERVHADTLAAVKLWLTKKYTNRFKTHTPRNVPRPRASPEQINDIKTTVLEGLPVTTTEIDYSCKNEIRPLSEKDVRQLQGFEETARGKSLQPELLLKIAEDQQHLQEKIRETIKAQSPADLAGYQKIKSIEKHNDGLKLELQSKIDPLKTKQILIPEETGTSKSEQLVNSYFRDVHSTPSKINQGLGIYGTLMGFQPANQMFSQGRDWEGGIMVAQGVHGVTELSGVNTAVSDFIGSTTKQAITGISKGLEETSAVAFGNTISKLGEAAKSIPVLSIAFTAFNIYEDVKQDNAIGFVDAALDGTILVTSLLGPEMLPVTLALTIIRLTLDPLYHEIKHELDSLPADASTGQRVVAVLRGIGLSLRDIVNSVVEIVNQFNLFHTISAVQQLEEEHRKSMQLVNELQTPDYYLKVNEQAEGDRCHTVIDFTQGKDSGYGGNLYVELTDHNSMIVTIDDPVTSRRLPKEYPFQRGCETMDIILGFGESVKVTLVQKSAAFLWIPVKKEEVIGSVVPDGSSLHGTYSGNSKPNRFYAIQQNKPQGLHYLLDRYFYTLYGNNGNDLFFLGPQRSFVHGGNGQDVYFVPEDGGDTVICNQAEDKAMDLMMINIAFSQISARKEDNDVKLFYNNNHHIVIKNWFLGDSYRHLNFKSSDSALFQVGKVQLDGRVTLEVTVLDYSKETSACSVDLKASPWEKVITVRGSNYNDVLLGNDMGNVLQGGAGINFLTGYNGKDMYIVEEKETCDTINNAASDGEIDIVQIAAEYKNVKVNRVSTSSLMVWDSTSLACVIIQSWKLGWEWQHIIFQTRDFVVFQVSNTTAEPEAMPLMVDFRNSPAGVTIDLSTVPQNEHIMTIMGSPFQDIMIGNSKPNFISGGEGDFLKGGDGGDTYIIDCSKKTPVIINNYAEDRLTDILILKDRFNGLSFTNATDSYDSGAISHDLVITGRRCIVRLQQWYRSEQDQHLRIRTEDGITFELPSGNVPLVYAVDCSTSGLCYDTIDTRTGVYYGATKIIGPPKFTTIWGNEKDNFIDPGNGGAFMSGLNGKDTYVLKKEYEGRYTLENSAEDQSVDFLILDAEFKDITISKLQNGDLLLSAPSAAKWTCQLNKYTMGKQFRHLIMQSKDRVWFTVSEETFEIQPLFLDHKSFPADLHMNLSAGHFHTIPTVYGSLQHRNVILGNGLSNTLIGGRETDVLYGLEGNDVLQGSGGKDYLSGGPGDDEIHGGGGNDHILAGAGDDVMYPGLGADTVYGGSGSDTLLFWGNHQNRTGVFVNLNVGYGMGADAEGDLYFSVENVLGTSYDDILIGSEDDNYLSGAGGSDLILPMGGYDVLHGGEGSDIYYLRQATGVKRIDNFSKDKEMDLIYFGTVDNEEEKDVKLQKLEDDLQITFPTGTETSFLTGVLLKNWFKSVDYRHISVKFGPMIVLEPLRYRLATLGTCVVTVTSSTLADECNHLPSKSNGAYSVLTSRKNFEVAFIQD